MRKYKKFISIILVGCLILVISKDVFANGYKIKQTKDFNISGQKYDVIVVEYAPEIRGEIGEDVFIRKQEFFQGSPGWVVIWKLRDSFMKYAQDAQASAGAKTRESLRVAIEEVQTHLLSFDIKDITISSDETIITIAEIDHSNNDETSWGKFALNKQGFRVLSTGKGEPPTLATPSLPETNEQTATSDIYVYVKTPTQIIPVLAKRINDHPSEIAGLIRWKITNNAPDTVQVSTKTEIQEWCPPIVKQVQVEPGETKEFDVTPFGRELLRNNETTSANLLIEAEVDGKVIFQDTRNVQIQATEDMIWSFMQPYDAKNLIACWVTPNDPWVEKVLSLAKERMFLSNRSFGGYQGNVLEQIKAIFYTLRRDYKISYVNSPPDYSIGNVQRIRYPAQCLVGKSANCIEGAVLMASLFERIRLDPIIVLIPGHAFVGVRETSGSTGSYFIETTMLGRSVLESINQLQDTFNSALKEGSRKFEDSSKRREIQIVDIKEARRQGIYPMPVKVK